MRLRHELRAEGLADRFEDAALDLQFSSLSSVGNDTKWLEELAQSLCGGDKARPRLRFVFPTRDQARPLPAPAKGCTPERAPPPRPAQASPHSQLGCEARRPFPGPSPVQPSVPACPQVKDSLEGWVAGSSIPCAPENADKLRARIRELSGQSGLATLCGWDGGRPDGAAGVAGRAAAVAHIIRTLRP